MCMYKHKHKNKPKVHGAKRDRAENQYKLLIVIDGDFNN